MSFRNIHSVSPAGEPHMVGDGFRPRNYIDRRLWKSLSPFLLLDYNEPWELRPTRHARGVDVHPHKGFETVTIAWDGTLAHEDSSGGKGEIGPGDVQWMTAGSGILHKEFHAESFSAAGGTLHMAQLWINLPAAAKDVEPRYQDIRNDAIPRVALDDKGSYLRVIAGSYMGTQGPANTFTPITMLDIWLQPEGSATFALPENYHTTVAVFSGNTLVNEHEQVRGGNLVVFDNSSGALKIEANNAAHLLLLSGEPINEPIASYGPFVMNTPQQIQKAINDYNAGKFGTLN